MTPKEEAQELFNEMLNTGGGYISEYLAGKYALITTERLIENCDNNKYEYWIKVKRELKKLLNYKQ